MTYSYPPGEAPEPSPWLKRFRSQDFTGFEPSEALNALLAHYLEMLNKVLTEDSQTLRQRVRSYRKLLVTALEGETEGWTAEKRDDWVTAKVMEER